MDLWQNVKHYSDVNPNDLVIIGEDEYYTWLELKLAVESVSLQLHESNHSVIALYADNSPAWIVVDLACRLAECTLLPLPSFFSADQIEHALTEAGATALIHSEGDDLAAFLNLSASSSSFSAINLIMQELDSQTALLPPTTSKITFTSGSTGQPKGVCLSAQQQIDVAESLLHATQLDKPKHLSILPFSTLLENIGGIYGPLISGGTIVALPQSALGFNGSSGFDLESLLSMISYHQPTSMILLPELLQALLSAIKAGWLIPASLQFIAVGGSRVSPALIDIAQQLGLPVYEGYGLSECASVVSLNTPNEQMAGTVGKPLNHVDITIEDGEIVVSGSTFLGYINDKTSWQQEKLYTGDLGYFDEQNYLHINGRKKNLLISSFGRNINPEWVESELLSNGLLKQCVVFGDAQAYCIALIYPRNPNEDAGKIKQWIESVNNHLPDYARVKKWLQLSTPLNFGQALLTSNSRPVRRNIEQYFAKDIEQLYLADVEYIKQK